MTEEEWDESSDPNALVEYLHGRTTDRKLRLFGCACCRRIWPLLGAVAQHWIVVAEEYDDEGSDCERLEAGRRKINAAQADLILARGSRDVSWALEAVGFCLFDSPVWNNRSAVESIKAAAHCAVEAWRDHSGWTTASEQAAQADLLRCIVENPYWPGWIDLKWLTSTVVQLAKGMYESRDFSPMPILADALQDAGCDNDEILTHCRKPGPHARGCWVVDLVLGKE